MIRSLLALLVGLSIAGPAAAASLCVYDPAGRSGDFFRHMESFAIEAPAWGAEVDLQPYTDEETAVKDYQAGHCDGVVATGVRLQRFNRFPATLEAMGAVPSYAILSQMVHTLAKYDSAREKLVEDEHATVGFLSAGAVYLFVRDRSIDTVADLAGKRIATMDYDAASPVMVEQVGAIKVPADLGSIGPKFNNGDVDACYMSAPGYEPFELHRGIEPDGGVIERPLAMATLQVMLRTSAWPASFREQARTWLVEHFDETVAIAKQADETIPDRYWIAIPDERAARWNQMFQEVRIQLRDEGVYDPSMLSALRKLRCSADPSRAECAEQRE